MPAAPIRDVPLRPEVSFVPGTIAGTVRRADDGRPVRGARVEATSASGAQLPTTASTDRDGQFVLRSVPPGRWTIRVSKTGLVSLQSGQRHPLQPTRPVDVISQGRTDVEFRLSPGAVISGYIVDGAGDPVAGVQVDAVRTRVRGGSHPVLTSVISDRTDDTGAFRLHSLPSGEFYVTARLRHLEPHQEGPPPDALPTFYPGTSNAGDAVRVALRTGEHRGDISFAVMAVRGVQVSGVLSDSSGKVVDEGRVELLDPGSGRVIARPYGNFGLTYPDGRFMFTDIAPGTYAVTARVDEQPSRPAESAYDTVVISGDGQSFAVRTQAAATVVGTVTAPPGKGLPPSVEAWARPVRLGAATARAEVAAGAFALDVPPGPALLGIDVPAGWALASVEIDGADVTDRIVDLPPGAKHRARITVTDRVTRLVGTVTTGSSADGSALAGPPADGATVIVFPREARARLFPSRHVRSVTADALGRFQVEGLAPALEYLAVAIDGVAEDDYLAPELLERLVPSAIPVALKEGGSVTMTLPLTAR